MSPLRTVSQLRPVLLARAAHPLVDPQSERSGRKQAAVAAILRDGPESAEVLLIRRSEREGDPWSGQMALPGGRLDSSDPDLLFTAMRETREEIGLVLQHDQLIGPLDDLEAVARGRTTGLVIRPYVFQLDAQMPLDLTLNHEVAETIWAPLLAMHEGRLDTQYPYKMGDHTYTLPAWDVQGRVVWGLTHRILSDLLARI